MASPPPSELLKHAQDETGDEKEKPEWLDSFLGRIFFDPCPDHLIQGNELKKYCISCDTPVCQYCISFGGHHQHKLLKIYRHAYKDAVSLLSMEKYIDCTMIQPYKSNKRLIIALNPLPHCSPASTDRVTCEICNRRLTEPELYKYCSISCKVMAFSRKSNDSEPPFLSIQTPAKEEQPTTSKPAKAPHRRKGTPHRAPFF